MDIEIGGMIEKETETEKVRVRVREREGEREREREREGGREGERVISVRVCFGGFRLTKQQRARKD